VNLKPLSLAGRDRVNLYVAVIAVRVSYTIRKYLALVTGICGGAVSKATTSPLLSSG
jgi:hypothetical protein